MTILDFKLMTKETYFTIIIMTMVTVLCCLPLLTAATTEFVALALTDPLEGPTEEKGSKEKKEGNSARILKWLQLDYDPMVSSAKDVKGKLVTEKPAELGHWFDLDLAKGGGLP